MRLDWFDANPDEPGPAGSEHSASRFEIGYALIDSGSIPAYGVRFEQFEVQFDEETVNCVKGVEGETFVVYPGNPLQRVVHFEHDRSAAQRYHNGQQHFRVLVKIAYLGQGSKTPYWSEAIAESIGGRTDTDGHRPREAELSGFKLLHTNGN